MENKPGIILIGGGGHCKAVIDVIESEGKFEIAGIIDKPEKIGQRLLNYSYIGCDEDIKNLSLKYSIFFITVGQIKSNYVRVKLYNQLKEMGLILPVILSPRAYISKYSKIGESTVIMHHAIINSDTIIGKNCIVNSCSLIEHDVIVGDHSHISTAVTINGGCTIGNRVFIGSSSVISNNVDIANDTIIGAGSVVMKSLPEKGTYLGNPIKRINPR